MAVGVQANLYALKVAASRLEGVDPSGHAISVASPGAVKRFRETLIEPAHLKAYSEAEVQLRLREIWGQFCLFGWALDRPVDPESVPNFAQLEEPALGHCETTTQAKHDELHAVLWKLRYVQRRRTDEEYASSPGARRDALLASRIRARVFDSRIEDLTDEQLLLAACEHAGMLKAIRWIMDGSLDWRREDLMVVGEKPF